MNGLDKTVGVTTGFFAVGGTSCIGFTSGPRVNSVTLQHLSGGTCTIVGVSSAVAQGFVLQSSIPVTFEGPVSLHINSIVGATGIIQFIKHLNSASEF